MLQDHPRIGRQVPEAEGREDVRELIFQGYRVVYLIEPEQVHVLNRCHRIIYGCGGTYKG